MSLPVRRLAGTQADLRRMPANLCFKRTVPARCSLCFLDPSPQFVYLGRSGKGRVNSAHEIACAKVSCCFPLVSFFRNRRRLGGRRMPRGSNEGLRRCCLLLLLLLLLILKLLMFSSLLLLF